MEFVVYYGTGSASFSEYRYANMFYEMLKELKEVKGARINRVEGDIYTHPFSVVTMEEFGELDAPTVKENS